MENITIELKGKQYLISEPTMDSIIDYEKMMYLAKNKYEFDKYDLKELEVKANSFFCLTSFSKEIRDDYKAYTFGTLPLTISEEFINEYMNKIMPWYYDNIYKMQEEAFKNK